MIEFRKWSSQTKTTNISPRLTATTYNYFQIFPSPFVRDLSTSGFRYAVSGTAGQKCIKFPCILLDEMRHVCYDETTLRPSAFC
ncbi:hypothetical protein EYC84_003856 [Monilinia fructicola]|uniref:Uncharacterized protein n=1 Tax=Monilinia fructicola TaxID=38448 RepID=A0A5M9JXK7_MONFR|nr:hypothetical protein EYC84_003856 [Monilinia fructicola]